MNRQQTSLLLKLSIGAFALSATTASEAEEMSDAGIQAFTDPYAFVDRFMDSPEVKELGFPVGPPYIEVGMIVEKEKAEETGTTIDIVSATASNGEVTIELDHADIGIFELWDKWVLFDRQSHMGTWVVTATDSTGASATAEPVLLEYGFELPLVENVVAEKTASGDLNITWPEPEVAMDIKEKCDIDYRLRLLENVDNQYFRSDGTTETAITVPASVLEEKIGESLDGVWGRIEMACRDKVQKNENGVGELESRSNTFFPLK